MLILHFTSNINNAWEKSSKVPGWVFDFGLSRKDSYENSDVEVHADRQQWLDVALVDRSSLVQTVEDDTQSLYTGEIFL